MIPKLLETMKVKFKRTTYWLLKEVHEGGGRALAPLDHCDENGDVITLSGLSFAHVTTDGKIMRYQEEIGTVYDLKIIK
jgi:hypothetical protein